MTIKSIPGNPGISHILSQKSIVFKASLAVISGLLCFGFSVFNITYTFGEIDISILWSLIFPITVSLAFGPKYGLISALSGGAWYPFLLWESNGWANVLNLITLTVLIVVVGFTSQHLKISKNKYSHAAIILSSSLAYAVFLFISLRFVYNVFLSFNPPIWSDNVVNHISVPILLSFFLKDLITFGLIILFSETLLKLSEVRRFLGLKVSKWMKQNSRVFLLSISVAFVIWGVFYVMDHALGGDNNEQKKDYLQLSFMVIILSGGILSRVLIEYHESELKSKSKLNAAKQKAEESDRLKSAFLKNLSHEIRTPMNGIMGFTTLLKEPGLTGTEQQDYIDIIQKSGNRMLNTVNDIIEISKIQTNQVKINLKRININLQLENIFSLFRLEAEKKGIQFRITKSLSNSKSVFITDEHKFKTVISHLVKNAIKYSVSNGFVELGYEKKENCFEFYVKDTGIGIPKNRQRAIFNRFEQADIEDKLVYEGSGLGLSITKAYIKMLNGKIWLKSKEGVGSTFFFSLPLKSTVKMDDELLNAISEVSETENKKLKVLIVEDDDISYRHLCIVLKKYACEISRAKNGLEAVKICKENSELDLILMDLKIPDINGIEATKQIRDFNSKVIIIAQTAYAFETDKEKALHAGCNNYITKPINKFDIQKLIEDSFSSLKSLN